MAVLDLVSMDPYLCVAALPFETIDATKMHATACQIRARVRPNSLLYGRARDYWYTRRRYN